MHDNRRMPSRVSAFVIWAVVAISAAFWALRLMARSPMPPAHAVPVAPSSAKGDLARLFGAAPSATAAAPMPAPAAASRYRLVGIAAPKSGAGEDGGVALIAVDGKPARPFRVGAPVDGELTLRSVDLRTASLGLRNGAEAVILEIAPRSVAATGTVPPAPSMSPAQTSAPTAVPAPAPAPASINSRGQRPPGLPAPQAIPAVPAEVPQPTR